MEKILRILNNRVLELKEKLEKSHYSNKEEKALWIRKNECENLIKEIERACKVTEIVPDSKPTSIVDKVIRKWKEIKLNSLIYDCRYDTNYDLKRRYENYKSLYQRAPKDSQAIQTLKLWIDYLEKQYENKLEK